MKYFMIVSSVLAIVFVGVLDTPARADECNELTYLTFSAPVGLPGVTLPAGTYRFMHVDCATTNRILRVTSQDGAKVYGTFLTIPDDQMMPSDEPEVILAERPAGQPEAIKAWFYPGETRGDALRYPKSQAATVAEAPVQRVFVTSGLS